MRVLVVLGFLTGMAYAQNCSLESLENDKRLLGAGEFKGPALLGKLESLIKELKILSDVKYEGAQKNAMKHCLRVKDSLFQKLMFRPEPSVQESATFQEMVSEYYKLHEDPKTALVYMDRAVEINPESLPLLIKNFQLYAEVEDIKLRELSGKPLINSETQRVLLEYIRRAERIANHPEANKLALLEAYTSQAFAAKLLSNFSDEMQYWNKVLSIDPKNKLALESRFQYFLSKRQITECTDIVRRMARENLLSEKDWLSFLQLLANTEKWEDLIAWSKKAPAALLKSRTDLQCQLARGYLELGRKNDAQLIMKALPKDLKGEAASLAAQNRSRLREIDADKLRSEGRLSEALDEYKNALPNSPRPLSVKEKMSFLIYEYRKGLKFQPPAATQADLEEVVNLLEKSVYQTELKSNLFNIYLHSLQFLARDAELKKACSRFKELYVELVRTKDYLKYCK